MTPMPVTTTTGRPLLSRADAIASLLHRHRFDQRHAFAAPVTDAGDDDLVERTFIRPLDPRRVERAGTSFRDRARARQAQCSWRIAARSHARERVPVARTGTSGMVSSQARSSPVAGSAPVAPEMTAQRPRASRGATLCHIRASAALTAPGGRPERSDITC